MCGCLSHTLPQKAIDFIILHEWKVTGNSSTVIYQILLLTLIFLAGWDENLK